MKMNPHKMHQGWSIRQNRAANSPRTQKLSSRIIFDWVRRLTNSRQFVIRDPLKVIRVIRVDSTPSDPLKWGKYVCFWACLAELRRSRASFVENFKVLRGFFNLGKNKRSDPCDPSVVIRVIVANPDFPPIFKKKQVSHQRPRGTPWKLCKSTYNHLTIILWKEQKFSAAARVQPNLKVKILENFGSRQKCWVRQSWPANANANSHFPFVIRDSWSANGSTLVETNRHRQKVANKVAI